MLIDLQLAGRLRQGGESGRKDLQGRSRWLPPTAAEDQPVMFHMKALHGIPTMAFSRGGRKAKVSAGSNPAIAEAINSWVLCSTLQHSPVCGAKQLPPGSPAAQPGLAHAGSQSDYLSWGSHQIPPLSTTTAQECSLGSISERAEHKIIAK